MQFNLTRLPSNSSQFSSLTGWNYILLKGIVVWFSRYSAVTRELRWCVTIWRVRLTNLQTTHTSNCVATGASCIVGQANLNMADVEALDEEPRQEESTGSVKSEPDETFEETPNGVKT